VDQYSRKTWGARIKNRSEIPRLMDIHFPVMKGKRKPVKYLRCDNAGEHGAALKQICAQHGVILEMTAPNTPQQNGVVERKIVTDRTRAHAMMEAARLNDKAKALLRAEAEAMAEKISNISCNNHCGMLFLNDMFGEASRLRPSHLIQFGRIGYVTNRVKLQKRWVDKTTKCIMVGYADDHSPDTYRMFNPETNKVILSRDVRWAEWKRTDPYDELNIFKQVKETRNRALCLDLSMAVVE
jgi:transposase InsO family protein